MLLDEELEMALTKTFGSANWVQLVPLKFQRPASPTTQTSVAEIASTALVATLPVIWVVGAVHAVPLNCRT
jgi:hypothetical protein